MRKVWETIISFFRGSNNKDSKINFVNTYFDMPEPEKHKNEICYCYEITAYYGGEPIEFRSDGSRWVAVK